MDRVAHYRQIVKDLITRYAQLKPAYGEIEIKILFDEGQDQYQLLYVGWDKYQRIHNVILHLELRGRGDECKIWIQYDGIEGGVAEELVAAGIPRSHIVLGFHPEKVRPYTEYAVT
jgi:XisI protein